MKKILIVEDDASIAEMMREFLLKEEIEADLAGDGETGIELFEKSNYDLVVLDIMLPKMSGLEVCSEIRKHSLVPILFVTAKKEDADVVEGLNYGANDYIMKPFSIVQLIARIKANIRMYESLRNDHEKHLIEAGELEIDKDLRRVLLNGEEIHLKRKEYELLLLFLENPGRIYTKENLFEIIWGFDAETDISTVTVHVQKLRKLLHDTVDDSRFIRTVWGVGYMYPGRK